MFMKNIKQIIHAIHKIAVGGRQLFNQNYSQAVM